MNIKEIVDNIIKEADVQANSYSVADRIARVNARYLFYIEKAVQIGSKVPISNAEATSETFTVVAGSNTFTRTISDVPIKRVDFRYENSSYFDGIPYDQSRKISGVNFGEMRFWADEKRVFIEEGYAGTLRVTYDRGAVTLFTVEDYALESGWPSPDWLPETFHDLLWLDPAYVASRKYSKGRSAYLKDERDELRELFNNHYGRESAIDSAFETDTEVRGNYR
jgi:hypothetical protein